MNLRLTSNYCRTERRDYLKLWGSLATKMRDDYYAGAPYWYLVRPLALIRKSSYETLTPSLARRASSLSTLRRRAWESERS